MQQIYLPKAVCRGVRVDVHTPPEAVERHRRIRLYERLRAEGCSEALALEAVGTPRSTLFRWRRALRRHGLAGLADRSRRPAHVRRPQWTRRDEAAVWDMRRRFPFMGRANPRPIRPSGRRRRVQEGLRGGLPRGRRPLFVLPPKSPKRNGRVEKANDSSRTEFRGLCAGGLTLDEVRPQLAERQHFHNHVRPHQSLNMQTPMECLQSLPMEGQTQSHMC